MESIKKHEVEFANKMVRTVALKTAPEMRLVGYSVGPFEEGQTCELPLWIAEELEKIDVVKIGEENVMNVEQLEKLRWLQSTQKGSKLLALPPDFYPMVKHLIRRLSEKVDLAELKNYERALHSFEDLVDVRGAIIVGLAMAGSEELPENLTVEEKEAYEQLRNFIRSWKQQLIELNKT